MRSNTLSARLAATVGRSSAAATYRATLDALWRDHLAARPSGAPTVVSLFAGCGGSSLGYSGAGFREALAVEWDGHACETFRANFPGVAVHHGDIAKLTDAAALEAAGLESGELDVLDGSPPCQGFSTAGKRRLDDPRNDLFRQHVRLLRAFRPRALVMENVSGMVKGKMRLVFKEVLRELKAAGYRVRAWVLNAADHGVPQDRRRLIFVGLREDLGVDPTPPRGDPRRVPAAAACEGVGAIAWRGGASFRGSLVRAATEPAPTITASGSKGFAAIGSEHDAQRIALLKSCVRHKSFKLWARLKPGQSADAITGGAGFNAVRMNGERPSPTILESHGNLGLYGVMHWAEPRRLTIPEVKRLCSFPDAFALAGKFEAQWARLGNSVPPLMMRAVARHVRRLLGTA